MIHGPQWNLVEDIFLIPNAHAQERTIFSEILETVDSKDLIVAGWLALLHDRISDWNFREKSVFRHSAAWFAEGDPGWYEKINRPNKDGAGL